MCEYGDEDVADDYECEYERVNQNILDFAKELKVEKVSLGLGQGFVRCNCGGKCATNACSCFKSQIGCNTKCHQRHSNCQNDGSKWSKPSNYLDEEEEDEEE